MTDESPTQDILFEVLTPLGFRVRVTRARWDLIVTVKHPAMAGRGQTSKRHWLIQRKYGKVEVIRMSIYFIKPREPGGGCVQYRSDLRRKVS